MADINVGAISEALNNKADRDFNNIPSNYDYVVESHTNEFSWYRKYKSGWVEQGGRTDTLGSNAVAQIVLPIEMKTTSYSVLIGTAANDAENTAGRIGVIGKTLTTTGFSISNQGWTNSYNGMKTFWQVKGYAA